MRRFNWELILTWTMTLAFTTVVWTAVFIAIAEAL